MKLIIKILVLMGLVLSTTVCNATNVFQIPKSDSNIKPLVFPLSMVILENRPSQGFYFSFDENSPPLSEASGLNISNNRQLSKTLGATDPARIAPSRVSKPIYGDIGKEDFQNLTKGHPERILFLFRREISISGQRIFNFQKMETASLVLDGLPYNLKIRTCGILYLTKQNKILILPSNVKESSFFSSSDKGAEPVKNQITDLGKAGLKELANEAKIILNKNKYEKRRSNY